MLLLDVCLFALIVAKCSGSSITNGTCYYKAGEKADERYAPCGNTISGNFPCCQLGDKINEANTCTHDGGSDIYTYVAGCTDPNYEDDHCPQKGDFADQQWVGLVWVDCYRPVPASVDPGIVSWRGCKNDGTAEVGQSPDSDQCVCEPNDDAILIAPARMDAWGNLPQSKMQEIEWFAGYSRTDPTVAPTSTSTARTSSSSSQITSTASASSNNATSTTEGSAPSSTITDLSAANAGHAVKNEDLKGGAIAGIVIGTLTGLGLAIGAIVFVVLRLWRKRKPQQPTRSDIDVEPENERKHVSPATQYASPTQYGSPWSGDKPELPGSRVNQSPTATVSPNVAASMGSGHDRFVYKPYRPGVEAGALEQRPRYAAFDGNGKIHELPG